MGVYSFGSPVGVRGEWSEQVLRERLSEPCGKRSSGFGVTVACGLPLSVTPSGDTYTYEGD